MSIEVRIQLRHFLTARAAPGSEEVEHNDFLADVFGELKAFAASGFELEIGRDSPLPFRAVRHVLSVLPEELLVGSRFKDEVQDPEQYARQHNRYVQKRFAHLPSGSTARLWLFLRRSPILSTIRAHCIVLASRPEGQV